MRRNERAVPVLPCGAHLVAIAYGTGRDSYLAVVLGFIPAEGEDPQYDKYVTWLHNSDPGCEGFAEGHYFEQFGGEDYAARAWKSFAERGSRLALKAHLWKQHGLLGVE